MKHKRLAAGRGCLTVGLVFLAASVEAQVVLVDFGTSNSFRGVSVEQPDEKGHTWNGFAPGDFLGNLRDRSNVATTLDLGFTTGMASDSYNGPAGETSDPPTPGEIAATVFDPGALGDLGATNAVIDFIVAETGTTVRFELSDLDPTRTYKLTFFGSKKYPQGEVAGEASSRTTTYAVTDSNLAVQASTTLLVGVFTNHNSNTVATLSGLVPDHENKIYVSISGLTSSNAGYLNALSIEGVDQPALPPADETVLVDFGSDDANNGADVVSPDTNGSYWNSIWSGAFTSNLVNVSNDVTTLDIGFSAATGADNFNGPNGVIDAVALDLLGGSTNAVNDYYVSSRFGIFGLDPARTYALTFFGSHKFSGDETTVYSVYTDNAYTSVAASARLNVQVPGDPTLPNSNRVVVITNLAPQAGNALYVGFEGISGNSGYLNAMQIDAYDTGFTYARWSAGYPGLGGPYQDDDGDGLVNFGEFGTGGDPTNRADTGSPPILELALQDGSNVLHYVYRRRVGSSGVDYRLQVTSNLLAEIWTDGDEVTMPPAVTADPLFETVTNLVPLFDGWQFIRMLMEEQ